MGLTLVEVLIAITIFLGTGLVLVVCVTRMFAAVRYAGDLTLAMGDVSRVVESVRDQNSGPHCTSPTLEPPAEFTDWDTWLSDAATGGGKNLPTDQGVQELVVLSSGEGNPLPLTVAVCWRRPPQVIGECRWDGIQLLPEDRNGDGVIMSPAMVSGSITCRR